MNKDHVVGVGSGITVTDSISTILQYHVHMEAYIAAAYAVLFVAVMVSLIGFGKWLYNREPQNKEG